MLLLQKNTLSTLTVLMVYIESALSSDCPNLAVLGEPMNITVSYSDLPGFAWTRPNGGLFIVNCPNLSSKLVHCGGTTVYTAVANTTFSQLTIDIVTLADVGLWHLTSVEQFGYKLDVCSLNAAAVPSCNITFIEDAIDLDLGVEISLAIDVTDYYCTRHYGVNISIGDVTEKLFSNTSAMDIMTLTSTFTFNVNESHFGDVRLTFGCEDFSTSLTCGGVTRLSRPFSTDCSKLAVLGEPMNIMVSYSDLPGFAWTRPNGGLFIVTCPNLSSKLVPCGGTTVYTAVANTTFSQLTIDIVTLADVGLWRLTTTGETLDVCSLRASEIAPSASSLLSPSTASLSTPRPPTVTTTAEGATAPTAPTVLYPSSDNATTLSHTQNNQKGTFSNY